MDPVPSGVVKRRWSYRFAQQFSALLFKTGKVAVRNRRSSIVRLIVAPFLFIFLVFVIEKAITSNEAQFGQFKSIRNPASEPVKPIPACEDDSYNRRPCYDFIYTPDNDPVVNGIVANMRTRNPGRAIPDSKVRAFASRTASNDYLLNNPERTGGAVHFQVDNGIVSYTLQTNSTAKYFKGVYQDSNTFLQLPLQVATEREIARLYFQREGRPFNDLEWAVSVRDFAHPSIETNSVVGAVLGPFLFAANMFGFVLVISGVVLERELKLRQALRTMGMMDSSYWASWMVFELVMAVITSLLICAFGAMFQFDLFLKNSFGLVFFTFLLFQMAMTSLAFFLSAFMGTSSAAVNCGFAVFIIGWIMQIIIIFGYPYTPDYKDDIPIVTFLFTIAPWSVFVKALSDLGDAGADENPGLRWSERDSYCQNIPKSQRGNVEYRADQYKDVECYLSVNDAFGVLVALWIIYFVLALYFDNVLANESGVRRAPWYFLMPNYWNPSLGRWNIRKKSGLVHTAGGQQFVRPPLTRNDTLGVNSDPIDSDVGEEERRMRDLLQHRTGSADALAQQADTANAIELFGLQKVFKAARRLCGLRAPGSPDFWAIKGSWFAIEKNQLFCLLGPNGAGKTTTINCLTGVLPPSGGDALVYGQSLSSAGGMDEIRSKMGVCPQFDILWNELTGQEHMLIYGNVKGLDRKVVKRQADDLLGRVKLGEAANYRSGSYSGGMKRRLSVAIALLGDPQVVYLDEPTTGMDPISRRHVWDIIEDSKHGRAIVLTTHSMEEADILGDRIAIMARGRLRALGSSLRLKAKFGSGYQVSVSVQPSGRSVPNLEALARRAGSVKSFFADRLGLTPSDETKAYIQYLVPREKEAVLPGFLAALEASRAELGITDVQISLTSLEEVFLKIAKRAEMEAARAEARAITKLFLDDGSVLEVPIGEEEVTQPTTGVRYAIKWAQDDAGGLQILEWKPIETPRTSNGSEPALPQIQMPAN